MPNTIWIVLSLIFSLVSYFPLIPSKHWIFRFFDFVRIQLLAILALLFIWGIVQFSFSPAYASIMAIVFVTMVYHFIVIYPYLPKGKKEQAQTKQQLTALCVNVQQENDEYKKLLDIINEVQPDILLTTETNAEWEQQLKGIEKYYSHITRVPKENRYGMHFYTKLEVKEAKVHYIISEEYPSIEAIVKDEDGKEFLFWGVHPPPPSPTEKPTAKQKDAELLQLAKLIRESDLPTIVSGDFNNVCWSKTSRLFSEISCLLDARINRGIYATFPAYLPYLGFPLDLLFHSDEIAVNNIQVLKNIGSDHLPLQFEFNILQEKDTKPELSNGKKKMIAEEVQEGKEAI